MAARLLPSSLLAQPQWGPLAAALKHMVPHLDPSRCVSFSTSPGNKRGVTKRTAQRPRNNSNKLIRVEPCELEDCRQAGSDWCRIGVSVPRMDWAGIFSADVDRHVETTVNKHNGIRQMTVEGSVRVVEVTTEHQLGLALGWLGRSMEDDVLAIDLEWKRGVRNKVALIQLASSSLCVLVRTHKKMRSAFPAALMALFRAPTVVIVGFSWETSDEAKMQKTWSIGKKNIQHFLDLDVIAWQLGYRQVGLRELTQRVLGVKMNKSEKLIASDWTADRLGRGQCVYAALDAIAAGQVFRTLREWHENPQPCVACGHNLGAPLPLDKIKCTSCTKEFDTPSGLKSHCIATSHTFFNPVCKRCGRVVPKKSSNQSA